MIKLWIWGGDCLNIVERIEEKYKSMTKKQKKVSDFVKVNLDTMTFVTLKDLSNELNVSENTILSTCLALGLSNFNELKYECRKALSMIHKTEIHEKKEYFTGEVPTYELNHKEQLLNDICGEEFALVQDMFSKVDIKELFEVAEAILRYKRITICGRGISYLIGEYLSLRLTGMEIISTLMNTELNDSIYHAIPGIDEEGLLIAIYFPDYYFMTTKIVEYAKKNGVKVILISNSKDVEIKEYCDYILEAPTITRLFMNTLTNPMAIVNLLTSAMMILQGTMKTKSTKRVGFEELF